MDNWEKIIRHTTFRYIEQLSGSVPALSALESFAVDDALAESVSNGDSLPVMRLWSHPDTVVLGIVDGRLPFLEDGVRFLEGRGYDVIIRNSGGLAVALDEGVLNISLVIPNVERVSIYEAYDAMVHFIQFMLRDVTNDIEAYEIEGSYCPGDYDLSIQGRKFAGIAQRRIRNSAVVQIYMDVEGDSRQRADLVRRFYEAGKKNVETRFTYPDVRPETMASLSELVKMDMSVLQMKNRALAALEHVTTNLTTDDFSDAETAIFQRRLKQMKQRNERISPGK